jgi:hypothetical protein
MSASHVWNWTKKFSFSNLYQPEYDKFIAKVHPHINAQMSHGFHYENQAQHGEKSNQNTKGVTEHHIGCESGKHRNIELGCQHYYW